MNHDASASTATPNSFSIDSAIERVLSRQTTRTRKPRGGGFCKWGCGRPVTAGLSRKKGRPFSTCGMCRKRYGFRAFLRRLEQEAQGTDPARAIHARQRLEAVLAEYEADPERYEWTPEDDEHDAFIPDEEKNG